MREPQFGQLEIDVSGVFDTNTQMSTLYTAFIFADDKFVSLLCISKKLTCVCSIESIVRNKYNQLQYHAFNRHHKWSFVTIEISMYREPVSPYGVVSECVCVCPHPSAHYNYTIFMWHQVVSEEELMRSLP